MTESSAALDDRSRPRTEKLSGRTNRHLTIVESEPDVEVYERPKTRVDCLPGGFNAARPCPFAGCRFHLLLDVRSKHAGHVAIAFPFGDLELDELPATCALDVADDGPRSQEEVAALLNVSPTRVEQLEREALRKCLDSELGRKLFAELGPSERDDVEFAAFGEVDPCDVVSFDLWRRGVLRAQMFLAGVDRSPQSRERVEEFEVQ